MEGKKGRVSDYINDLIKEHKRIIIKAGVSSGKTYMATEHLPFHGSTCISTSRKTPKMQFIENTTNHDEKNELLILHQWDIMNDLEKYYGTDKFQYVVIDEIHCLLSDTFTEASFALGEFIKSLPPEVTIIMMSACADRVKDFIEKELTIDCHYVDMTEYTFNTKPKNVLLLKYYAAWNKLLQSDRSKKSVYFCYSTEKAYEMEAELLEKGIRAVAITSQSENRKATQDDERKKKETRTLEYIIHNERLPRDVDVLITTSKLREGLNLHDRNIKSVISELKDHVSLVQCVGRVRHGVDEYCIVTDKGNYKPYLDPKKAKTASGIVKGLNTMVNSLDETKRDDFEFLTRFDHVVNEYDRLIIRNGKYFAVNQGLIYENRLRAEEYDLYTENPAGYIANILKMPVIYGFNQDEITSIIEPYVDKKISVSEKNILRDELNRAGIEGSQLQVLLRETRYEYVSASNSAWYKITKVG